MEFVPMSIVNDRDPQKVIKYYESIMYFVQPDESDLNLSSSSSSASSYTSSDDECEVEVA